jgi:hypothetical protein
MRRLRHYDVDEQELIQTEQDILEGEARRGPPAGCPSDAALQRFAAGREDREQVREEMRAHISVCNRCVQFMGELRKQKIVGSSNRRVYIRKSALALAAVIIVAVSIWIWNRTHRESQVSNQVATVDLRQMSPMRGGDPAPAVAAAKVPRQAGQLRLILPVGSKGTYEAGLFRQPTRGAQLQHDLGQINIEDHNAVLVLKLSFAGLGVGRYWLGVRQGDSEWAFFPLSVE